MYIAKDILAKLDKHEADIRMCATPSQLAVVLNRAFGKRDRLKFEVTESPTDMSIGGYYDAEPNFKHILLQYRDASTPIELDDFWWPEYRFLLSQVIQHETIHQLQWLNRQSHSEVHKRFASQCETVDQLYLADVDELDAYAHDIAMEIKFRYPRRDPYRVVCTIDKTRKLWSYNYYRRAYRGVEWSSIKKHLLRRVVKWIPHVVI